ncbi:penicillin-binding protein activator [Thalassobius sp. Cn5-15]|uniref:penicillin-binding protein activator n=1 Tax=Thalassobius sp. Cn5-15 TaxID=2917763 RepID=UPI001EF2F250|nr:penicillin-binding protein activator [Thalassobius sp. Cn5-15]MCG7493695.1 penicillin-binding protein activator [Thalassobius sp. Cn5-15]
MFAVFRSARKSTRPQAFEVVRKACRRVARPLFTALSLAAIAACTPGTFPTVPGIDTNRPVTVALLVPGGSDNAGDQILARSLQNAARLAIADLEGVDINLRVYNTAGDPTQAATQAVTAVSDGAKIILGPVYSASANAVAVAVAPSGVNVLSFSNNAQVAGGNLFILGPTFQNTAERLIDYAAKQGKANVVVAHDTSVAGNLARAAITDAVNRNAGATMVQAVGYERSQQGVIQAIPAIRSAVKSGGDAVFFNANSEGALSLITQLLDESGVDPAETQYIGLTRWDVPPQTLELPSVQGGWFAKPDPVLTQQFSNRYRAAYGSAPHPIGGLAYDGMAAIGALLKDGNRDALTIGALTQRAGFQGVNGIFRLRFDGTNERGLAVAQIQDKQVVIVDPAPRSFGAAGF